MIIVKFTSGLGNQMFQYNLYRFLKEKYPETPVRADITWFNIMDEHHGFELCRIFENVPGSEFSLDKASIAEIYRVSGQIPTPVKGMLGTTFGGNHLAMAAAIAVADIIKDEGLVSNALTVGNYLKSRLISLSDGTPGSSDASLRSAPPIASLRSAPVPPLVPRVAMSSHAGVPSDEASYGEASFDEASSGGASSGETPSAGAAFELRPYSAAAKREWTRPGSTGCSGPNTELPGVPSASIPSASAPYAQSQGNRIADVRGRGLMLGVEFEGPVADIRKKLLFDKHIFTGVSGKNMIRLLAPLILTKDDVDIFIKALEEVI